MARLADIEVDEVSYVDKAANKRRFLFVKRFDDTSVEEGGNNLEMLKQFTGDKEVIGALESINSSLEKLGKAIEAKLTKSDLSEEDKKNLLEKQEEFKDLMAEINEGFEKLFLGKFGHEDEDEKEMEEEEEEEKKKADEDEDEKEEEEEVEMEEKEKGTYSSEGKNSSGVDEESKPGMKTEQTGGGAGKPGKVTPSADDSKLTSPSMSKELDKEDLEIIAKIDAESKEFAKEAKEYKELLSK